MHFPIHDSFLWAKVLMNVLVAKHIQTRPPTPRDSHTNPTITRPQIPEAGKLTHLLQFQSNAKAHTGCWLPDHGGPIETHTRTRQWWLFPIFWSIMTSIQKPKSPLQMHWQGPLTRIATRHSGVATTFSMPWNLEPRPDSLYISPSCPCPIRPNGKRFGRSWMRSSA